MDSFIFYKYKKRLKKLLHCSNKSNLMMRSDYNNLVSLKLEKISIIGDFPTPCSITIVEVPNALFLQLARDQSNRSNSKFCLDVYCLGYVRIVLSIASVTHETTSVGCLNALCMRSDLLMQYVKNTFTTSNFYKAMDYLYNSFYLRIVPVEFIAFLPWIKIYLKEHLVDNFQKIITRLPKCIY